MVVGGAAQADQPVGAGKSIVIGKHGQIAIKLRQTCVERSVFPKFAFVHVGQRQTAPERIDNVAGVIRAAMSIATTFQPDEGDTSPVYARRTPGSV